MCWVVSAWLLLAFAPLRATATPITSDSALPDAQARSGRVAEHEILRSSSRSDGLTDVSTIGASIDVMRASERGRDGSYSIVQGNRLGDPRDGFGTQTMLDSLRGFVNAAPPAAGSGRGRTARAPNAAPSDPLDWVDLGPEAREWIQDSFKTITASVLQLEVNDRGRASFSVLGVGDFGVSVSADRSQIALTAGDNVILTAQRNVDPAVALASSGAAGGGWHPGSAPGAGTGSAGQSPIKRAIELALEIATHPLSMLVYLITTAYIVLWSILKRQPGWGKRHRSSATLLQRTVVTASGRRRRRHRRSRRHRHA